MGGWLTQPLVVEERLRRPGRGGYGALGKGHRTKTPTLLERFQMAGDPVGMVQRIWRVGLGYEIPERT